MQKRQGPLQITSTIEKVIENILVIWLRNQVKLMSSVLLKTLQGSWTLAVSWMSASEIHKRYPKYLMFNGQEMTLGWFCFALNLPFTPVQLLIFCRGWWQRIDLLIWECVDTFFQGVLVIVCIQFQWQVLKYYRVLLRWKFFLIAFRTQMRHRRQTSSLESGATMEQPLRLNTSSVTADQSRTHTLFTIQELLLEYSLVIIVLGCFVLVSLSPKIVRDFRALEDGVHLA